MPRPKGTTSRRGPLYPLDLVYRRAGIAVPAFEVVAPDDIPLPYRALLVHDADMTLTLERHFGGRVVLRPLSTFALGGSYFPPRAARAGVPRASRSRWGQSGWSSTRSMRRCAGRILDNEIPLGSILRDGRFEYTQPCQGVPATAAQPRDDGRLLDARAARALRPAHRDRPPRPEDRRHRRGAAAGDTKNGMGTRGNGAGYDCVVIGGGPAGSTTATVLAQHGRRVLLLEREPFPRYHIGESLMPYTWFTFERLGVLDWFPQAACPKKYSVQFVSTTGAVSQPFYFFETIKHECSTTWQVVRSDFDRMLLENARDKGVDVRQGVAVRDLVMQGGRAVGVTADVKGGSRGGVPRGRRRRCLGTRHAAGRAAGLEAARPGPEQDRHLHLLQGCGTRPGPGRGGHDGRLHPGQGLVLVHPGSPPTWSASASWPRPTISIAARATRGRSSSARRKTASGFATTCARPSTSRRWRVTGEFSYRSTEIGGDGFCLAGDAFSFLDPVFSTGVFLALKSGEMAGDAIHRGLDAGAINASTFGDYRRDLNWALDQFRRLVLSFYDQTFSFREFVKAHPDLHPRLVDALVGNVFADLRELFDALGRFAERSPRADGASDGACQPQAPEQTPATPWSAGTRLSRRVQFYETDAAGIVHFSWFYRYMEEAEHASLARRRPQHHPAARSRHRLSPGRGVVRLPPAAAFRGRVRGRDCHRRHRREVHPLQRARREGRDGNRHRQPDHRLRAQAGRRAHAGHGHTRRDRPAPAGGRRGLSLSVNRCRTRRRSRPANVSRARPSPRNRPSGCGSCCAPSTGTTRSTPPSCGRAASRRRTSSCPATSTGFPLTTKAELVADQDAAPPWGTVLTYPLACYTRYKPDLVDDGAPAPVARHDGELAVDARLLAGRGTAGHASGRTTASCSRSRSGRSSDSGPHSTPAPSSAPTACRRAG